MMSLKTLLALLAAGAGCAPPAPAQHAAADLVVVLTVDQMRVDYLTRYQVQYTGAFKRLLDQGAVFTNAFHDHAVTETAVGHASLLAGRFPRSVGIISNQRGVADPQARFVTGDGEAASPFRFRGSSLFDWMRLADPLSRALSVSVKDRAAILPLGRAKQNVFWWRSGAFSTSTYYADTLPAWVRAFNARGLPEIYRNRPWTLSLDPSAYAEPDAVPYENFEGKQTTFPHARLDLTVTPWMDEILAALALAGVDALNLGKNGHTDLLAVSFSPTDYIGHRFGPDSREIHDQLLRLDRTMGAFIDSLYARFGADRVAVVLNADHGVTPFPQKHARTDAELRAHIVDPRQLIAAVGAIVAGRALPEGAVTLESGMLTMAPQQLGFDQALMDSIARTFARAARATPGVLRADFVRELAAQDTVTDAIARRWLHTIPADRTIPVVVTLKPGHVWSDAETAHHGSPHDADAHVPLIFLGAPFKPGRYERFARTVDIAPTLARMLRIQPSEPLDGKPLTEALR